MLTLFRFCAPLPLWLLHGIGVCMGWAAYLTSATYRQRLQSNAALAGHKGAIVHRAVSHAGRMTAELPRLWLGRAVPIFWGDTAYVDQAYQSGKGIVFLTLHMGCFEVVGQGLAERYTARYGPLTALYRPSRHAGLAQVMEASRQRPGLETAPTTLPGVRKMIKALRAGQAVCLLPDQVPPEGLGVWSPMFGKPAYTMTLAARLLQQTGAIPVLCWGERLAWGRGFLLHFSALSQSLSDDLDTAVGQINHEMETVIAKRPDQYLWGYARYKKPKASV